MSGGTCSFCANKEADHRSWHHSIKDALDYFIACSDRMQLLKLIANQGCGRQQDSKGTSVVSAEGHLEYGR